MSIPANLLKLVGDWAGMNHLWLDPSEPAHSSRTTLRVSLAAQGQFLTLQYTWAFDTALQDGLLVLGQAPGEKVQAVWIDSFHTQEKFMVFKEAAGEAGHVTLQGSYAAPPGPDWGWQIALAPSLQEQNFKIFMHNMSPDGEAFLAVDATYTRQL